MATTTMFLSDAADASDTDTDDGGWKIKRKKLVTNPLPFRQLMNDPLFSLTRLIRTRFRFYVHVLLFKPASLTISTFWGVTCDLCSKKYWSE